MGIDTEILDQFRNGPHVAVDHLKWNHIFSLFGEKKFETELISCVYGIKESKGFNIFLLQDFQWGRFQFPLFQSSNILY